MSVYSDLRKKIKDKKAVVTIVGLGYVGLPIALEFLKKGFKVNGLDTNSRRIMHLKKGTSYIDDIPSETVKKAIKKKSFSVTTSEKVLATSDVVVLCVPTPLRKIKNPDISYLIHASRSLKNNMKPGQLIAVESTTYPGTTREVILPELEKSGFILDKDFFLTFSPERIDPGNPKYSLKNIPKIVGGITKKSTSLGKLLYLKIVDRVVDVSCAETAEVTKLLENTFRIVNLGLINEFALLCNKLGIDVWEVIRAAKTKPFGFMPFYPGPGIGGHCIPADPMYLSWKARTVGFKTEMVDLAADINRMLPLHAVKRIRGLFKKEKIKYESARILIMGVTYKRDVNDLRESPALEVIKILKEKGMNASYHDPYIPYLDLHGVRMKSRKLTAALIKKQDIVVIIADHTSVNYKLIAKNAKLIFDTRNIFERKGIKGDHIVKL